MKRIHRTVRTSFVIVVLSTLAMIPVRVTASENVTTERSGRFKIVGPFTHRNLALYLVKGKDVVRKTKFVTLEQALNDEKVTIEETGNVRSLVISSTYAEEYVFIQAGDIVRGGKQDRTLSTDLIVPPGAKKMPLQSFCVESGRWQGRGTEEVDKFSMSTNQVASRELRVANRYSRSQREVWDNVADLQEKLAHNVGKSVQSPLSSSSLELTLENKDVRNRAEEYVKALINIVEGRKHIVGFVFAINGQLNTAEVYGSGDLFSQLWSKLLRTAAVEAFAELKKDKLFKAPSAKAAAAFLEYLEKSQVQRNRINDWLTAITHEGKEKVIFESLFTKEHVLVHVTTVRVDEKDRHKLLDVPAMGVDGELPRLQAGEYQQNEKGVLFGKVLDEQKNPVANSRVFASYAHHDRTDANGEFTLLVPSIDNTGSLGPADFPLFVWSFRDNDPYRLAWTLIRHPEAADLEFRRKQLLSSTIRTGEEWEQIRQKMRQYPQIEETHQGVKLVIQDENDLSQNIPGHPGELFEDDNDNPKVRNIVLVMGPANIIAGHVVDTASQPIANAVVQLEMLELQVGTCLATFRRI